MERIKAKIIKSSSGVCPRGKKLLVNFLDGILVFILSISIFSLVFGIYVSTDHYRSEDGMIKQYVTQITSLVEQSHLSYSYQDTKGNTLLKNPEEIAEEFALDLVYDAARKIDEEKYINHDLFISLNHEQDYDVLSYYYQNFYHDYANKFKNYDNTKTKEAFYHQFFNYINNDTYQYFLDETTLMLSTKYANDFLSYHEGNHKISINFFNKIKEAYCYFLNDCIADYMDNFTPYSDLANEYGILIDSQNQEILLILITTYLLIMLVYYFILPLVFHDGRTIFMKLFKLCTISTAQTPVAWYQNLIKCIVLIFLYLFMPCLIAMITLGYIEGASVIMTDFFNFFNLFALALLMFLFLLCSIMFTFYRKDNKQTFSELFSMVKVYENETVEIIKIGDKVFEIKQ